MHRRPDGYLIVLLSITLILIAAGCKRPVSKPAVPGNPAPVFKLKDLEGRTVQLTDFASRIVVIDFWATWCNPCKKATAELEALHKRYVDRGVVVIGISVDKGQDAAAIVKEFAARQGMTYVLLVDDGTAKTAYRANIIPATYVLDRQHIIRDLYPGFRPGIGDDIGQTVEKLL